MRQRSIAALATDFGIYNYRLVAALCWILLQF